jgi:uncharacterized protein (UPF0332 family)
MTPVTADLLERAAASLDKARRILAAGVPDVAAREAYMAAFHAAQAVLFERQGRAAKTHAGVHESFGQLAAREPGLGGQLGSFLPRAYYLKDVADSSTTRTINAAKAEAAINDAADFVGQVAPALGATRGADFG